MSDAVASTCDLCGRLVVPRQRKCVCGAVLQSDCPADPVEVGRVDYGALLPWLPLAGIFLLVKWAIDPGALVYTSTPAFKLYAITAIACAAVGMLASDRFRNLNAPLNSLVLPGMPDLSGLTPMSWFIAILLAWPFTVPAFLYVHYRAQAPVRFFLGAATAFVFVILFLYTWLVIGRSSPEGNSAAREARPVPAKYIEMKQAAQNSAAESHPGAPVSPAPAEPVSNASAGATPTATPVFAPHVSSPPPATHRVVTPIPVIPQPTAQPANRSNSPGGGSSASGGEGISILRRPK